MKGRTSIVSGVVLGGLLLVGAGCLEPGAYESTGKIPANDDRTVRSITPPTSRKLFIFETMARAESLATTQGLWVAPPQESGGGVAGPSRVEKGDEKRLLIKQSFLAEAGRRIANACGLSIEDVELIYRRGIEEGWPRDDAAEERVSSNWCG